MILKSPRVDHVVNLQCRDWMALSNLSSAVEVGGNDGASNPIGALFWPVRQCYYVVLTYKFFYYYYHKVCLDQHAGGSRQIHYMPIWKDGWNWTRRWSRTSGEREGR